MDIVLIATFDDMKGASALLDGWRADLAVWHLRSVRVRKTASKLIRCRLRLRDAVIRHELRADERIRVWILDNDGHHLRDMVARRVKVIQPAPRSRRNGASRPRWMKETARVALETPRGQSAAAFVAEKLGVRQGTAYCYLSRAASEGLLRRTGRGRYAPA